MDNHEATFLCPFAVWRLVSAVSNRASLPDTKFN